MLGLQPRPGSSERAIRAAPERCDRNIPCVNCQVAQRTRISTGFGQKLTGRSRWLSRINGSERKIDDIEHRLGRIERLLGELTGSLSNHSGARHSSAPTLLPPGRRDVSTSWATSEFAEHTVKRTSLPQLDPSMDSALSALRHIVQIHKERSTSHEVSFANQKLLPKGGYRGLPMPPIQVVVQLLREMKDAPSTAFTVTCSYITVENLAEYCRKVYFATDDFSATTFIIVNGGLYYILSEKAHTNNDPQIRTEYLKYRTLCADNLETVLGSLSLFVPASTETIKALLMGASRPSLAWRMNSIASQMCQTLGHHRPPPPADTDADDASYEAKFNLFSVAYMLDKGLALRLGRVSAFQDYDIVMQAPCTGEYNTID
ncbi:hypothetical protein DL769_007479 [Monosporascus sp. CRB-8-3]|nr:hypothetical protein DL769_007479 [Monosporascus sp. CRB-8-3]